VKEMAKHKIVFKEEDHTYTVDGVPAISVTQLLKAVGISKDFDKNDKFLMTKVEAAAEKGNYYDKLAAEAINDPFELTEWQQRFLDEINKAGLNLQQAQVKYGILKPFAVAGTGDFK
jgi:hydrogenase maturation factor